MMEQQLKGGVTPRTWYREHAHPVLLPLDEEETQLLRSLVGAAKQLSHHVILIHHALDGPESKQLDDLAGTLQGNFGQDHACFQTALSFSLTVLPELDAIS